MSHPYADLPAEAFWRHGVAGSAGLGTDLGAVWQPKVRIQPSTRIAVAGHGLAADLATTLRGAGGTVLQAEPAPLPASTGLAARFGYGRWSGRHGPVASPRQLVQLLEEIGQPAVSRYFVEERAGRAYDLLRPGIEPEGFETVAEALAHRRQHLAAMAAMLAEAEVFLFVPARAEAWVDAPTGRVLPEPPAGFDPLRHRLQRFAVPALIADLDRAFSLLRGFRKRMRMILAVSPEPPAVVAGGGHVLVAGSGEKAALRAAVGALAERHRGVDYFPALEIAGSPAARGRWLDAGGLTGEGREALAGAFLAAQGLVPAREAAPAPALAEADEDDRLICEEQLLDAFRGGR